MITLLKRSRGFTEKRNLKINRFCRRTIISNRVFYSATFKIVNLNTMARGEIRCYFLNKMFWISLVFLRPPIERNESWKTVGML